MAAVVEREKEEHKEALKGPPVPARIQKRLKRGREAMTKDANLRRLCVKFWRGEQNWFLNHKGSLQFLPNAVIHPQKQQHRIRNQYRFIHSIVEGKVSAATQRVPGYEITPATSDPQDIAAARLASQFAPYIYDKAHLRRMTTKAVTNAFVQREGFARPYFDPNVGPFMEIPVLADDGLPVVKSDGSLEMEWVGTGAIKVRVHSRSEVMWEPDTDFDESRWHAIESAMVIDEVEQFPGFLGGTLTPNADTRDVPTDRRSDNMVVVTEYLERPCKEYPKGCRLFVANDQVICEKEDYPVEDVEGRVVDEPALHRVSYTVDPEGDDRGLVEHLIDLARTVDDCYCKLLEWKNRCLVPQMMAPRGSNVTRRDDTPGATWYYNPVGGATPQWEQSPRVPTELFQMLELAKADMRAIAADLDVQPGPDVAAKTVNAAVEQANARWQSFLGDLAEFHSRVMRHCLSLAAKHYSAEQQVEIRGQYGWEPLEDFKGQDLRSQVNVRVLPGSIEAKGRAQVMQEIEFVQRNWPGALGPESALAAIHGGNAEGLIKSYELDVAAANELIRELRQSAEATLAKPPRFDSSMGAEVPGWMPRKQFNLVIFKQVIGDYIKTPDFKLLPPENQEMFDLVWDGLEWLEQMRALKLQAEAAGAAEQQGMDNAARPQPPAPMPQARDMTPQQADPAGAPG